MAQLARHGNAATALPLPRLFGKRETMARSKAYEGRG